jgi:DNA-binding NarL/FixJ family response regulator
MVTIQPLFADIIRQALAGHVAIEVVAQIRRRNRLEARLRALQPELVVVGLRRGENDAIGVTILAALPQAKVIVVSSDVRNACVYEVRPHRIQLRDFSMETLTTLLDLPTWLAGLS